MFCGFLASARLEGSHGWMLFLMGRNGRRKLSQEFLDIAEGSCGKGHYGNLEFLRKKVDLTAPLAFLLILKEVWPRGTGSMLLYNLFIRLVRPAWGWIERRKHV